MMAAKFRINDLGLSWGFAEPLTASQLSALERWAVHVMGNAPVPAVASDALEDDGRMNLAVHGQGSRGNRNPQPGASERRG